MNGKLIESEPSLTLVPARVDAHTEKTQFTFSALTVVVAAAAAASPAFLSSGNPANLALFCLSALLVAGIAEQISSLSGKRLSAAAGVWAGLLYAVYPAYLSVNAGAANAHSPLLPACLSLLSLYSYLRFRMLRERPYFALALISYAAGLAASVSAAGTAVAVALAELLLFRAAGEKHGTRRAAFVMPFFMVLILISTAGLVVPALQPAGALAASAGAWVSGISDPVLWRYLLIPYISPHDVGAQMVALAFVMAFVLLSARLIMGCADVRTVLWVLAWMMVSLLPDTTGAAPFFASALYFSAPLAVLLGCACLPCIDLVSRQRARTLTSAGVALLLGFAVLFTAASLRREAFPSMPLSSSPLP
jgi:hypothetical protein